MNSTTFSLKALIGLLLLLAADVVCFAQSKKIKFGKPTDEEMRMTVYEHDKDADAVFLYENIFIGYENWDSGLRLVYSREYRIKILKDSGKEWGCFCLDYREDEQAKEMFVELKACAINLVNGKHVKTELPKNIGVNEKISDKLFRKKIVIPDVQAGTVIDVKYTMVSDFLGNIPSVNLQHTIPVKYSYFEMGQPDFMIFNIAQRGRIPMNITKIIEENEVDYDPELSYLTEYTINEQENIPAIKKADYVYNINDYVMGFDYEMSGIYISGILDHSHSASWLDFCTMLSENEKFGGAMKEKNLFTEEVEELRQSKLSELQKLDRLMRAVQSRVRWNGEYSLFASKSLGKVLEEGVGNSADMNFLLCGAIKSLGHLVFPLMVNPRTMGRMPNGLPMTEKVNAFILCVKTDENTFFFLDASDKNSFINVIPPMLLVSNARFYSLNGEPSPVDLTNKTRNTTTVQLNCSFDEKNCELRGSMKTRFTNEEAYEKKRKMETFGSTESFVGNLVENCGLKSVDGYMSAEDENAVITEDFNFEKQFSGTGEIAFKPLLSLMDFGVSLTEENRQLPVEFAFPHTISILSTVTIPEGWTVEEMPDAAHLSFKDKDIIFTLKSSVLGNTLTTSIKYSLGRTYFSYDDYTDLVSFYQMLSKKLHQKIVLRKQ